MTHNLSAIVDAIPAAILVVDKHGVIVLANLRSAELFGYTQAELTGQSVAILVPKGIRTKHAELVDRFATDSSPRLMGAGRHLSGLRKDGTTIPLEIGLNSMTLPEGPFVVCALVDITKRVAAEKEKVREQTRFEIILRTASDGIHVLDRDGLLVEANDAFLQMLGYEKPDIGHVRVFDWDAGNDRETIQRRHIALVDSDDAVVFETRHRTRAGNVIDVEVSARAIDLDGRRFIYASSRDITERRGFEQQLRDLNTNLERRVSMRTEELAQLTRALGEFSSIVSHDLRAPLRALEGFSSIIQEQEADNLSPSGRQMFERIAANAAKMRVLIDDTLQFSRVARYEMSFKDVDMTPLVRGVIDELIGDYPLADVRVAELPHVTGDPSMLRQVWSNLIGNSLKYTSRTEKPLISVGVMAMGGTTAFFVRDNGAGFDSAHALNLFEMFRRFHSEQEFAGTGTGLAIVRRIVERHGGRIWAESTPNAGATFYFELGSGASGQAA